MYEKFLLHFNYEYKTSFINTDEFISTLNGKSFGNGIYRLFSVDKREKWTKIVGEAFPKYLGIIEVFAYDWMGRIFAINKNDETVLLFDPGFGEIFHIDVDIVGFHEIEISDYSNECLSSDFFNEWFLRSDSYILKNSECVGYIVPIFLNGVDDISNIEVSDMEVYWELMIPLINL